MKEEGVVGRISSHAKSALAGGDAIVAVYLFGSVLFGDQGRTPRDIDLAFLLDDARYRDDPLDASSAAHLFAADVSDKMDMKTDVVILNGASIEMAYEIVTKGSAVWVSDEDRVLEYECKIRGMYYDFRPFLENLRRKGKPDTGARKT